MLAGLRPPPFGAKYDAKVHHVTQSSVRTKGDVSETRTLRQSFDVLAPGVLRKTTNYFDAGNDSAVPEEYTRLSVGPLILVSHRRMPPPIAGDLLPYAFWGTKRLRDLVIRENTGFPDQPNGRFSATYVIDELHSDGSLAQSKSASVQCAVTGTRPASSFLVTLKGEAVLYHCESKSAGKTGVWELQSDNAYFPQQAWSFAFLESEKDPGDGTPWQWQNTLESVQ